MDNRIPTLGTFSCMLRRPSRPAASKMCPSKCQVPLHLCALLLLLLLHSSSPRSTEATIVDASAAGPEASHFADAGDPPTPDAQQLPPQLQSAAGCPEKCTCKWLSSASTGGGSASAASSSSSFSASASAATAVADQLRVKCGGSPTLRIASMKELDFGAAMRRSDVQQLDLSRNQLTALEAADFANFTALRKLDLGGNVLGGLGPFVFAGLVALEKLKLAGNGIVRVAKGAFDGMSQLKQIDLSGNPLACDCELLWLLRWSANSSVKLQPVPKCDTPAPFKGVLLKKLKIGTDLHCGSPLQPLLELHPAQDQLVFEGDTLTLRCRAPRVAVGAPGDSEDLPARGNVVWGWSQTILEPNSTEDIVFHNPVAEFPGVRINDARHLSDNGLLDSILRIPVVQRNHSGTWDCRLRTHQPAGLSRSIAVVIVSAETRFCQRTETANNKGRYAWPSTIRGHTVRLPCAGDGASGSAATSSGISIISAGGLALGVNSPPHASYRCSETGAWHQLDTDNCPYLRETTKVLEQFAKINMTIARGSVLDSARRLRNYTDPMHGQARFNDPWDVVYIGRTLSNYLEYVAEEKELASMLLDLVSQTMQLRPPRLLQAAQALDGTASRLRNATEMAAGYVQSQQAHKANVAVEMFKVRPEAFAGIICTWFRTENTAGVSATTTLADEHEEVEIALGKDASSSASSATSTTNTPAPPIESQNEPAKPHRTFQCNSGNTADALAMHGHIDAVVQVPANVFRAQKLVQQQQGPGAVQRLLVTVYKDASLFPWPVERTAGQLEVMSCVIGVKILNRPNSAAGPSPNLTDPIFIMLRAAPFHHELSFPRPVWWDPDANNGLGAWSLHGCHFSQLLHGLLLFACNRLGYYGLLQNRRYLNAFADDELAGARFRFAPPAIYAGCAALFVACWVCIVSYVAFARNIQMPRRARHALVNTWLALSALAFTFAAGIYQTEDWRRCQAIGLAVHYFSLSVLLWHCVAVSNMYKRMSRLERRALAAALALAKEQTGQQPQQQPHQQQLAANKPIMGIYLVGWGIALIICGISGSVNIHEYASYSYCFLRTGPALSALFVPAGILCAFVVILFTCIKCALCGERVSGADLYPVGVGQRDSVAGNAGLGGGGGMSEGTQATEHVDLADLLGAADGGDAGGTGHTHRSRAYRSLSACSTPTASSFSGHHQHRGNHNQHNNHHQHHDQHRLAGGGSGGAMAGDSLMTAAVFQSGSGDGQHSTAAQLRAHIAVLALYLAAWAMGAMAVTQPPQMARAAEATAANGATGVGNEEQLYAMLFAGCACTLAAFLVGFYGCARRDVRAEWSAMSCRNFGRAQCCRSRSVCDSRLGGAGTAAGGGEQHGMSAIGYQRASIARSSSPGSKTHATNGVGRAGSVASGGTLKAGAELNAFGGGNLDSYGAAAGGATLQKGNLNLVQLHRQQFVHNVSGSVGGIAGVGSGAEEVFYNPNQINVARKFFKKQKRLQKRNNFEYHRQQREQNNLQQQNDGQGENGGGAGADCRSEISSIVAYPRPRGLAAFASSEASKVNNTNIHVASAVAATTDMQLQQQQLQQHQLQQQHQPVAQQPPHNPNMLSDSCNESSADLMIDAERFVIGAESLRALTARRSVQQQQQQPQPTQKLKVNNDAASAGVAGNVVNIYTNVPETARPQHEIIQMTNDEAAAAAIDAGAVAVSANHHNSTRDEQSIGTLRMDDKFRHQQQQPQQPQPNTNDRNRYLIGEERHPAAAHQQRPTHLPLVVDDAEEAPDSPQYVNGNFRSPATISTASSPPPTVLEFNTASMTLSLNSPILAMNTIGLPALSAAPQTATDTDDCDDDMSAPAASASDATQSPPALPRDVEYMSSALEIPAGDPRQLLPETHCGKTSKSMSDLCPDDDGHPSQLHAHVHSMFDGGPTRSISCTQMVPALVDPLQVVAAQQREQRERDAAAAAATNATAVAAVVAATAATPEALSPILFSPSLCDLSDVDQGAEGGGEAPASGSGAFMSGGGSYSAPAGRRLQHQHGLAGRQTAATATSSPIARPPGSMVSSPHPHLFYTPDKIFDPIRLGGGSGGGSSSRRARTRFAPHSSDSPTSELGHCYQNSELSIRSHELYAPPPLDLAQEILGAGANVGGVDDEDDEDDEDAELVRYAAFSRRTMRSGCRPGGITTDDDDDDEEEEEDDEDDDEEGAADGEQRLLAVSEALQMVGANCHDDEDDDDDGDDEDDDNGRRRRLAAAGAGLNDSQSSIDELYQQITRRPVVPQAVEAGGGGGGGGPEAERRAFLVAVPTREDEEEEDSASQGSIVSFVEGGGGAAAASASTSGGSSSGGADGAGGAAAL